MARFHIGRDNWFLVIPALILGLVALFTINRMYRAGDIRRSIEVVTGYRAAGSGPTLGAYLAEREGPVDCSAEIVSQFYGTLDVQCATRTAGNRYRWRVHVGQRAFAPADDATRDLMAEFAPGIFTETSEGEDS